MIPSCSVGFVIWVTGSILVCHIEVYTMNMIEYKTGMGRMLRELEQEYK